MLTEFLNDGIMDMLKTVYPLKHRFVGGIMTSVYFYQTVLTHVSLKSDIF